MPKEETKVEETTKGGEEKKVEDEPEVGKMKRGDYMIHVFIEKARQLKAVEGNCDPIIEVKVMEQKKFTSGKDDIGTGVVAWNEHLFFEPKNVTVEQIEQAKVEVRVLDKGFFKDQIIGCFDFDVTYIYFQKDHAMLHKWVALSNPYSENVNEVQGYLKLSVSVSTSGDKQIQIAEDNSNNDEQVIMPPAIRPQYFQLHFRFFRAEKLPAMDKNLLGKGGSIDAYIICNYLGNNLKTDVITAKEGFAVDWNTEFLVPCQLPIMTSRIVFKLFDKDLVGADEIVGSFVFNLNDCMGEKLNGKYFWKNIYGSPLDCHGKNTDMMNANPEMASTWKGRILMQIVAEKTEKPTCARKQMDQKAVQDAYQYLQEHEYEIIAEVGQGIALPGKEKYNVQIRIADFFMQTDKPIITEGSYNRWSHRFKHQTFKCPYQVPQDMGRYYVYLMQGDKPICFYKGEVSEILDPNPHFKWLEMTNDLAIGKVTESHKAGLISVKISLHHKTKNGPIQFDQFDAWKKPPPKRLDLLKVRVFIFQCRDMPSADDDGQSDCYVVAWDTSEAPKKTEVIEDSNNPIFYQALELQIESQKRQDLPPFLFDIYDQDAIGDDFICRCVIPITEAKYVQDDDIVPEPKWHPCRLRPNDPKCGEILVSFSIVESDYTYKTPLNYLRLRDYVDYADFHIDVNLLGLRDLQSVGILPVKKAFIIFNLKSLVPPDDGRKIENVRTQPGPAGPNPTINTQVKLRIPLPKSPLYCPKLTCSVHDYIFKGLSQPLIGTFTIPVGALLHDQVEEKRREMRDIKNIIDELDRILKGDPTYVVPPNYSLQSLQTTSKPAESLDEEIAEERKSAGKLRVSVKVTDDLKKPLLPVVPEMQNSFDQQSPLDLSRSNRGSMNNANMSGYQLLQQNRLRKSDAGTPKNDLLNISAGMAQANKKVSMKDALKAKQESAGMGLKMKKEFLKQQIENDEKIKREFDYQRQRELEEFKAQNQKAFKNIIMATYEEDKKLKIWREVQQPPDSIFIGLGWDADHTTKKRHYRRYYPQELEKVKEIFPEESPFDSFEIMRGQTRGASKGWWPFASHKEDDSGEVSTEQVVGKFKGLIEVYSEEDLKEYTEYKAQYIHDLKTKLNMISIKKNNEPLAGSLEKKLETMEGRQQLDETFQRLGVGHLNITKKLQNLESEEILKKLLLQQTKCTVRAYLIGAFNLSSRDNGSESDPYLIMKVGNKVYNERDSYQQDQPNPEFNKYYDFQATFPGCPPLVIEVMDYDDIFGDDVIGTTVIDLEDRFFSSDWISIKHKPIEFRGLNHPSSSVAQGTLKMWVEINPTAIPASEIVQWDLTPKPCEEFEVRLVVFDTLGIAMMDAEGTSDVFVKAFFDQKEESKETDTHFRCQDGKASFNYRMLLKMTVPRPTYTLTLQAFDRDFFKSNDVIGDTTLDLTQAIMDCYLTKRVLQVNKTYYNDYLKDKIPDVKFKDDSTFYVPLRSYEANGQPKVNGQLRIQLEIYPKNLAEANKVGEARQEPNHSPFLTPPAGRLSFSLNPLKMFQQMIGPALRRKIYCYCCLAACLALCIFLAPLIIGNLISAGFEKLIGLR